jgi:hypothetical protein
MGEINQPEAQKGEATTHVCETGWTRYLVDKRLLEAPLHEADPMHPPTLRDAFQLDRTAVPQSKAGHGR